MSEYKSTGFSAEIVARLRGHIARFDLNQMQLAMLCDVSQSQFSKIIRGVRPISLDQVAALCDSLGMNMVDLFAEVEKFLAGEYALSSPIVYVEGERKLSEPKMTAWEHMDDWAKHASFELNTSYVDDDGLVENTDTPQSDVALAAKDRSKNRGEEIHD